MRMRAASKSMWWSVVAEQMESWPAAGRPAVRKSPSAKMSSGRPAARSRAQAVISGDLPIPVTRCARTASFRAGGLSPQPTSGASPQPSGTARRMPGCRAALVFQYGFGSAWRIRSSSEHGQGLHMRADGCTGLPGNRLPHGGRDRGVGESRGADHADHGESRDRRQRGAEDWSMCAGPSGTAARSAHGAAGTGWCGARPGAPGSAARSAAAVRPR